MARLFTCGFELGHAHAEGLTFSASNPPTFSTTTPRTGAQALQIGTTGGPFADRAVSGVLGRTYFHRAGFRVEAGTIGATGALLAAPYSGALGGANWSEIGVTNAGDLVFNDSGAGGNVMLATGLTRGVWHYLEFSVNVPAAGQAGWVFRLNGTQVASFTRTWANTAYGGVRYGQDTGGVASGVIMRLDDLAVNDDQGAAQNSWPADGKVYALRPTGAGTAGTAEGNWTKPGGSTTGKHTSVDNTPPVFGADSTNVAQAENMLRDPTSASADTTHVCTSYDAAGIGASDAIKVITPVSVLGNSNTTAKSGTLGCPANPTIAQATAAFPTTTASTTPTTWARREGTTVYDQTPARSTGPQIRLNRGTGTGTALVNLLAVVVDAQPAPGESHQGAATTTGGGTVTAAGQKGASAAASIQGGGASACAGQKSTTGTASTSGNGTAVAIGQKAAVGTARAQGNGAVTVAGAKSAASTGSVTGGGAVTATGAAARSGTATVTGGGHITVTGARSDSPSSDLPTRLHVGPRMTALIVPARVTTAFTPGRATTLRADVRATTATIQDRASELTVHRRLTALHIANRTTELIVDG